MSLYSSRFLFHLAMRLLYSGHFDERYAAIADQIPLGATVVEVCAGDGYLYLKHLRRKPVEYLGLDISPQLVRWAQRHGVKARVFDVWQDTLPAGDVIVIQASLYQFAPRAGWIIERMLAAARRKVIVAEPIHNLSASPNPILAALGRRLTAPDTSAAGPYSGRRFDYRSLSELFHSFETFQASFVAAGGKEMVGIFTGQARNRASQDRRGEGRDVYHSIQSREL